MNYRKSSLRAALLAFGCVVSLSIQARADEPGSFSSYNAAIDESSISGISSGAFMAVQFGTAWSVRVIKGVGVITSKFTAIIRASAGGGYINGFTLADPDACKGPRPT